MKPSELKKIIKPIVEECVKESVKELMLESGLLSSVISEVLKGVSSAQLLEQKSPQAPTSNKQNQFDLKQNEKHKIENTKKKLMENIGKSAYGGVNIFEGISATIPDETNGFNAMRDIDPNDPGVNVDFLDLNRMQALLKGKPRK